MPWFVKMPQYHSKYLKYVWNLLSHWSKHCLPLRYEDTDEDDDKEEAGKKEEEADGFENKNKATSFLFFLPEVIRPRLVKCKIFSWTPRIFPKHLSPRSPWYEVPLLPVLVVPEAGLLLLLPCQVPSWGGGFVIESLGGFWLNGGREHCIVIIKKGSWGEIFLRKLYF